MLSATPTADPSSKKAALSKMSNTMVPTAIAPAQAMPGYPPAATAPCATTTSKMESGGAPAAKGAKRARTAKAGGGAPSDGKDCAAPSKDMATTATMETEEKVVTESGTWLIVAKAVRMHLKNHEHSMHCGADALPALNAKLSEMINDAVQRAVANGRKTLKQCDF